ncbi:MAG TPA: transglutaminase domain-containing protein [Flavitalea sp.]|nr:transglutaminase domain-containing protein [Flavitalea sp.]
MKIDSPQIIIAILAAVLLIASCNNASDAIQNSSRRKINAQAIVDSYSENPIDSLKLKSATFLLTNLSGKISYHGPEYDSLVRFMANLFLGPDSTSSLIKSLDKYFQSHYLIQDSDMLIRDEDLISSDLLRENIEYAVRSYREAKWSKDVSFNTFCEFILPYKTDRESFESFRPLFFNKFKPLFGADLNLKEVANFILKNYFTKKMDIVTYPFYVPELPLSTLKKLREGSCRESSSLAVYAMRSAGIPVAIDFTPQWPHRGMGHSWAALILSDDSCIDFEGASSTEIGNHLKALKSFRMAKAFRHMYSKQVETLPFKYPDEETPDFFHNMYLKDVTNQYIKTVNLKIDLDTNFGRKLSYLCVFDNQNWVPIAWGQIAGKAATFSNMGANIVYLPALFSNHSLTPAGYPVIVDSVGNQTKLIPDKQHLQILRLKRKYPVFDWWNTRTLAMNKGYFEASQDSNFRHPKIIFQIRDAPEMTYQSFEVKDKLKAKYWRYVAPDSSSGDIAELELYNNGRLLKGTVMRPALRSLKNPPANAFDGNPLTYYQGDSLGNNWVGLSFPERVQVQKIRFLPRNDDNFIKENEIYELFYWDLNYGWVSVGSKTGTESQELIFEGAPINALYVLKNNTKGVEERIFTYSNDTQT